jgi:hypothetical protein
MELFSLILGALVGVGLFVAYQVRREMKAGATMNEALRFVVKSGPGPWRPPK